MTICADFAVVIPVLNEENNIPPLVQELCFARKESGPFNVLFVDDHSTDHTFQTILKFADQYSWVRGIRLCRQSGQSAALYHGILNVKQPLIVTMDGDGQNDPFDIKPLVNAYKHLAQHHPYPLVNGLRKQRKDSGWRCFSSFIANRIRGKVLGDGTPDSGCGIKVYAREMFLSLPAFNHMHRFLPALVKARGGIVASVNVNHRPRHTGRSNYGTLDRLAAGVIDLLGVLWLRKRVIPMNLTGAAEHIVSSGNAGKYQNSVSKTISG